MIYNITAADDFHYLERDYWPSTNCIRYKFVLGRKNSLIYAFQLQLDVNAIFIGPLHDRKKGIHYINYYLFICPIKSCIQALERMLMSHVHVRTYVASFTFHFLTDQTEVKRKQKKNTITSNSVQISGNDKTDRQTDRRTNCPR